MVLRRSFYNIDLTRCITNILVHKMSGYRQLLYPLVFRTKESVPNIKQEHHRKITFEQEYSILLQKYGITPDERFFP